MRPRIIQLLCTAALLALVGLAIAQDGPIRNSGPTVARPKKADSAAPGAEPELPPIPSRVRRTPEQPGDATTFHSEVQLVTVDVAVLDGNGNFVPGIPGGNFRLLEDNVPQKISKVELGEAPMTIAMVIEFSNKFQQYWGPVWYQTLQLAWGFADALKPEDYLAIVAYDMKTEMLTDFTTDKTQVHEALSRLNTPAWSEANMFDALADTADRMSGIEGRKAIVLISTGIDTFSKLNYDKTRKILQGAGVPVYAVGLMQALRERVEMFGGMGDIQRLDFLQADNTLRTFAKETGGAAFFPRFEGEFPTIFRSIEQGLRNQYVVTYTPSNAAHDGTVRKIKVDLVNPATNQPLVMKDQNGKAVKYTVVAKSGYKAPNAVE